VKKILATSRNIENYVAQNLAEKGRSVRLSKERKSSFVSALWQKISCNSKSIPLKRQKAAVRCLVRSSAMYAWPFRSGQQCSGRATNKQMAYGAVVREPKVTIGPRIFARCVSRQRLD
jgi:hypothetical protein